MFLTIQALVEHAQCVLYPNFMASAFTRYIPPLLAQRYRRDVHRLFRFVGESQWQQVDNQAKHHP